MDQLTIEMPSRIRALSRDGAGRPIPWFVATIDGKPDFRVIRPDGIAKAVRERRCWVCGQRRAHFEQSFVIGPMCAINRTSAEPPAHLACAVYSALACPFLNNPNKVRREAYLSENHKSPAGVSIPRNPGVALVWTSAGWVPKPDGQGGVLFDIGRPIEAFWFAEGRQATRGEVLASIESGLPILREMAEQEGLAAVNALEQMTATAMTWIPK